MVISKNWTRSKRFQLKSLTYTMLGLLGLFKYSTPSSFTLASSATCQTQTQAFRLKQITNKYFVVKKIHHRVHQFGSKTRRFLLPVQKLIFSSLEVSQFSN